MSSMPPPGGVPPYDPQTQWRIYREQQKAAWRAQREAWRAQRHAWKGGMGVYAPRVPSIVGPLVLITVGIVAMLIVTHKIDAATFWDWYGHWWPLLLIGAGLAMLAEWAIDSRSKTPVRRGGNFVGLLIFLAVIGIFSAWAHTWWNPMRAEWGDNGDFFNSWGKPQHDLDQQVFITQVPADAVLDIENPRGDISISSGDGTAIQVQAHEVAFADSDDAAKKIFDAEAAHVTLSGKSVLVKSAGHDSGRVNLMIVVPKSAQITVSAGRGDVTAAGLGAGATITAAHGDIHLSTIQGSVQVHFSTDRGDFSAHSINGDITADGRCNDLTLSEVKGRIMINGDIFGEAHMENVSGPVHLHTSVTDLEFGALPGDMTLNDDDLRMTESRGAVRVSTHSKNVDLTQIYGDSYVDDRDGNVTISPAGPYSIDAKISSGHGDMEITLPPNASATVDGRTQNGDIASDFPLSISGDESKTITGRIGGGAAKIALSTDVGDVRIKRGSGFPPTPPAAMAEGASATPAKSGEPRHLRAPKNLATPVVQ